MVTRTHFTFDPKQPSFYQDSTTNIPSLIVWCRELTEYPESGYCQITHPMPFYEKNTFTLYFDVKPNRKRRISDIGTDDNVSMREKAAIEILGQALRNKTFTITQGDVKSREKAERVLTDARLVIRL